MVFANISGGQSTSPTLNGGCNLVFRGNTVVLLDDLGRELGGIWIGYGGPTSTASSSACTISPGAYFFSGGTVSYQIPIQILQGGPRTAYGNFTNDDGISTGWVNLGSFSINRPPVVVSGNVPAVTPGAWTTVTFTGRDPDGWNGPMGLNAIRFLMNYGVDDNYACNLIYYPSINQIGNLNDAKSNWQLQPVTGAGGMAANSYCTVDAANSSATRSGTDVTVNARVKFNVVMADHPPLNGYMYVVDGGNLTAGWTQLTSGNLVPIPPATPTLIGPANGVSNRPLTSTLSWTASSGATSYDVYLGPTSSPALMANVTATSYTPPTLNAGVTYFWNVVAKNSAGSSSPTSTWFFQTAAAGGSLLNDGWRVGVRPTGSYWGAAGEQVDLLSGNLNFSIPLLKAQARGGWTVPLGLSYNSQLWRQGTAGTSLLGRDIGYGLGWVLQAGSVAPNSDGHTYIFSDSTGAQYRLDQFAGGIYTSLEGPRVAFDTNVSPPRLHFPDGSFWVLGSASSAGEQDAGTLYPTLLEDSNGNQVQIGYAIGIGSSAINSSGRIQAVHDPRATAWYPIFVFGYNADPIPHLVTITNNIWTSENYNLTYSASQPLTSPFSGSLNFGTTTLLQILTTRGLNISHSFAYVPGSAELSQVTTPFTGVLGWQYRNYAYGDGHMYREVQTRTMQPSSGAATYSWNLALDSNPTLHGSATMTDVGAGTTKVWNFQTSGTFAGLATAYEERDTGNSALLHIDYTWTQDPAGVPYVGTSLTTLNPGSMYAAQTKSTQTLDAYGNILQSSIYDYGNLSTPARTYNYTYLTDSNYTSRYIRNRVRQVSVTSGGLTPTLLSITYDTDSGCGVLQDHTGLALHDDAAYGVNFTYRGNPTSVTKLGATHCYAYEITGVPYTTKDGTGNKVDITLTANASLPGILTPNGNNNLATNISYAASFAVTSVSGPNGAGTTTDYDGYGRPATSKVVDGAVTNYTYTYNPNVQTATLGNRWKKTTMDGFGRVTKAETGHDGVTVSVVDTQYAPCACSPLGKLWRVSQPHDPAAPVYWTTYTYDGSGRTLTATAPDGSITRYSYQGNQTTVTDPAGKWKTFSNDAMGNLVTVTEPNPGGGANLTTSYSYNAMNQFTQVTMPRAGGTQTRTFQWSGSDLVSATNPENGTVTYQYDSEHHVTKRTDAKGQQTLYSYDIYARLIQKRYFGWVTQSNGSQLLQEQPPGQVDFYYDVNPINPGYSEYAWGRLAAVGFAGGYAYQYSYNQAGRVIGQKLMLPDQVNQQPVELEARYGWDNEGRMTSLSYPDGPQYNYQFDAMGRANAMTTGQYNQRVATAAYGPAGELTSLNGDTRTYNVLGQLTRITGGGIDLEYVYTPGQNNGRITQQIDHISGEQVTYQYDQLNRLSHAETLDNNWGFSYSYDGFGNLTAKTVTKGTGLTGFSATYDPATNHGTGYDANGNMGLNSDCGVGCWFPYDVENRLASGFQTPAPGFHNSVYTLTYTYDPWGKRIAWKLSRMYNFKYNDPPETKCGIYFYGLTGQKLAEYTCGYHDGTDGDGSFYWGVKGHNVYFAGHLMQANGVSVTTDRLGSVRVNGNGERFNYLPYGEERTPTADDREKFGTYFRDSIGVDYADQRYYDWGIGRFMTPDPGGVATADPRNPGSWNRYGYVNGDPVNFNDPTGRNAFMAGIGNCGSGWASDASLSGPCLDGAYGDAGGGGGGGWFCGGTYFDPNPNPACYAPVPIYSGDDDDQPDPTHNCTGPARVLQGNAATIGHPGGFSGTSAGNILITASGAAIIPEQWGGSKAALRPYLNEISGFFPDVNVSFKGVVDVVGGQSPCPNDANVRSCLMSMYPDTLIIELPGAAKDYGSTNVVLTLPIEVDCPKNTHEQ